MNKLIIDTLTPLAIPVSFQSYSGKAKTYITFFIYNEQGELWADNVETQTGIYIQIDVWSDVDYTILVENVINAMVNAGFKRRSANDLYTSESKIYHKVIRFSYIK